MNIDIPLKSVASLAEARKMTVGGVTAGLEVRGDALQLRSLDDASLLAGRLVMPLAALMAEVESDLDQGIKVCRKQEGFVRESERKGKRYYTYQHLATSNAAPELMALRVTVHCDSEEDTVLNAGHHSKELIYVTRGEIRMNWQAGDDTRMVDLHEGDSVYLNPDVRHSFRSLGGSAELLAFNYS
jgi:mannose-6-phosphate isomerase-like protein (cupin superfamily)